MSKQIHSIDQAHDHFIPSTIAINRFYEMPTSPVADSLYKVMSSGTDLDKIPARNKKVNHEQKIEILTNRNRRKVVIKTKMNTVELELSDIEKLTSTNKTAKKLFIYLLIKINEQAYNASSFKKNYIQFDLNELISAGLYKTVQSARKGFKNGMSTLTSFKLGGEFKKGKKSISSKIEVLFTGAEITNGVCTIFLNERVNWNIVTQFYTILPRYCFNLSSNSFDLLYYIFFYARQNIKRIEENRYINISLRVIQQRLNLPSENTAKNPQRDIKDPVIAAVKEIMIAANSTEFNITAKVDNNAPIKTYLDGYLRVEFKGEYASYFIKLSHEKNNQIEQANKRKERIIEKAIAINTAKSIENKKTIEKTKHNRI